MEIGMYEAYNDYCIYQIDTIRTGYCSSTKYKYYTHTCYEEE